MNIITIAGRIGQDATTREVGDSTVTSFSVADDQKLRGEKVTMWWNCSLWGARSEEHTSELQSLMRISYAVFCLNKKKNPNTVFRDTKLRKTHELSINTHKN